MPVRKQNTAQSVVAKGYRTANYIRLGLAFFFTAAVLGTGFGSFDRMGIQAEAVGTVVYFLIGIIGLYRMRGGRSPVVFSKAAAVGDMTILGAIAIAICLDSSSEAYLQVRNTTIYAVFFIALGYSGLLGSGRFTMLLSLWGGILYAASLFAAAHSGVQFGADNDFYRHIVGIPDAVILILYFPVVGGIVAGVLGTQKRLTAVTDKHAKTNADLVASLTEQQSKLADYARNLDASAGEFKGFISETTGRIETQAAALEQANAVTEELTASASKTAEIVQNQTRGIESMAQGSTELRALIDEITASNEALTDASSGALKSMQTVESTVEATNHTLGRLEEAFASVNKITGIMTEIADKTNLLSLNAAIEAARAGDAGRGFAVVADEVSKLADYTGQNVRQIAGIVAESMATIDQARKQSAEASGQARDQKERNAQMNRWPRRRICCAGRQAFWKGWSKNWKYNATRQAMFWAEPPNKWTVNANWRGLWKVWIAKSQKSMSPRLN